LPPQPATKNAVSIHLARMRWSCVAAAAQPTGNPLPQRAGACWPAAP